MAAAKPTNNGKEKESEGLSDAVKAELETLTATERAAVIMLLLGEQQAAERGVSQKPRRNSAQKPEWGASGTLIRCGSCAEQR